MGREDLRGIGEGKKHDQNTLNETFSKKIKQNNPVSD